jgi:hypothetical protein
MCLPCFAATLGIAALIAFPARVVAQPVPGRDLLDFPLGVMAEAPALATQTGGGLYNPAALLLGRDARGRASVAVLNAPGDRGLQGGIAALEWRVRPSAALAVSAARAGIGGIDRTTTDPLTELGSVVYDTYVLSTGVAVRPLRHVAVGTAVRYRMGRSDTTRAGVWGTDFGVLADGLLGRYDVRVGASSFLWQAGEREDARPSLLAGAEGRVWGVARAREVRVGGSYLASRRGEREGYGYLAGRLRAVDGRLGLAQARRFDSPAQMRVRLGFGLEYARFHVGIAREESDPGFGPIYQFTLSTLLR